MTFAHTSRWSQTPLSGGLLVLTKSIQEQLAEAESPGSLLADIDVQFSSRSLPIGFPTLESLEYFRAGEPDLVIIGARPACGKSALLCQMAYNLAQHDPVMLFSLEMDKRQIKGRLMSLASEIPIKELRYATPDTLAEIETKLSSAQLFFDDTNGLDINTLYARAVARHRRTPLSALFIDYIQIIGTAGSRSKSEEIEFIARRLKELAAELGCPVIAAAQLSRNIEGRVNSAKNKELVSPIMSDLADSAGIEKWSDLVLCLHKQFVNGKPSNNQIGGYVIKNRHGSAQDIKLQFRGDVLKFFDRGPLETGI